MWICDKCNGENVSQEWSMFLPMNDPDHPRLSGFEDKASWLQKLDSYWCDAVSYTHLTLPTTPYV